MDRPPFESKQQVIIRAPLKKVWDFNQDLTQIARYHPRVKHVDFVSGTTQRQAGVAYQCHFKDGKNMCLERDIEIVPMERIVTVLPEDTMGLYKIFPDYIVETRFTALDENNTSMEFIHYYSTKSLKARLVNGIAKRKIAKESQETLNAIKKMIEESKNAE